MFSKQFIQSVFPKANVSVKGFQRIWTDSRSVRSGDLFVAIPGEKFDGHGFIAQAAKLGATGALISNADFPGRSELPKKFTLIQAKNTTEALRKLAKAYRKKLKIPIIAVAGSNGKTTTKEWIWFLLSQIHTPDSIFKTEKSQNSILGIALSLLQIRNEKMAVIEIGIDEPNWMDQHLEVVAPTHGIITTIAEEHLNRLKNIETVAKEELKLLKFMIKKKGSFAANQDSSWIKNHKLPLKHLTYALDEQAEIEGFFESPQTLSAFGARWSNPLPGKHNAQNLLAALTIVRLIHPELTREDLFRLSESTQNFQGEAHRSRWIKIKNDVQVFDDCYNANPDSMERALQSFIEISRGCRQHAVIGDMLDLGDASENAHQKILNQVIVLGMDNIYLFGPKLKAALNKATNLPKNIRHFETIDEVAAALHSNLKFGDAVFLKGSRGMALERILEKIK